MLSKEEIAKAKERLSKKLEDEKILGMLAHIDKIADENILNNIAIETLLQYIDQLEQKEKRLKDRLEKDVINITKTLQDGKHSDDYSKCRLKAYRTKTKEILKLIGGSYD